MARFLNFSKENKEEFVEDSSEDYLALNEMSVKMPETSSDLEVRVFVLDSYDNIRDVLDVVRSEKTMCLIDIHLLRNKDTDELRRAVDKLKKTIEAVGGELVGFHENWIMAAPKNVRIHKGSN